MATTAVSSRRGNTEENKAFAGVPGEIVADLGANETGDSSATIILHTGNGIQGGIRMARQDFANVTYTGINNLANYSDTDGHKALMFKDLSNLQHLENQDQRIVVEDILKTDYNIASTDGSNLNTKKLAGNNGQDGNYGPTTAGPDNWPLLAKRTLGNISEDGENKIRTLSLNYWNSNADTYYFAEGYNQGSRVGTKLAYANTTNINTADLAEGRETLGRPGKSLAYADFSNVEGATISASIHAAYLNNIFLQDYEVVENKSTIIDEFDENDGILYPTNTAVITYVGNYTTKFATTTLDNVTNWDAAAAKENYYKYLVSVSSGGAGYSVDEQIATDIAHPDGGVITLIVTKVGTNGVILSADVLSSRLYGSGFIATETWTDDNKGGIFIVRSQTVQAGNLMQSDLDNSDIENYDGSTFGSIKYERTVDAQTGDILSLDEVNGTLFDKSTMSDGKFSAQRTITDGGVLSKLETNTFHIDANDEIVYDTTTSIAVSKTKAYLNKNEVTEAFNQDHELLNRKEIDDWKQSKPAVAVSGNIAVFDVNKNTIDSGKEFAISNLTTETNDRIWTALAAKTYIDAQITTAVSQAVKYMGTVPDETYLPTTGQQNGDLYWITEFSATPPTGMVAGEPGKAIWNGNLSTPDWDYSQDATHQPDGISMEYDANQKLKVRVATRANNAISTVADTDPVLNPDGGIYVDASSFVPSNGYVAVPSLSSATSGQILSNNGTTTVWINGTPPTPSVPGVYHLVVDSLGYPSWVSDALLVATTPIPEPESSESGESGESGL